MENKALIRNKMIGRYGYCCECVHHAIDLERKKTGI